MDSVSKAEAKNALANTYFRLKQYTYAIQFYTQAIEICPQIAKYYGNRAQCHIKMYDFVKGLFDAKKCVEYDPSNVKGYLRLVECSLCSGDLKFAEKTIQTAIGVLPQNNDILSSSARIRLLTDLEAEYASHIAKKSYANALDSIEKCLEQSPLCLEYMVKKAECFMLLERLKDAEVLAADILRFKSTNEDALYIKACSELYQRELDNTSFNIIKDLKRQQPDHLKTIRVFQNVTKILNAQHEIEKALRELDYELAYTLLRQAIKIDENYKCVRKMMYLKKIEIAGKNKILLWSGTKDCTGYLELFETDVNILKKRAQFYMDLEEFDLAIEDYQLILTYEDNYANKYKLKDANAKFKDQLKENYKILKLPPKYTKVQVAKAFRDLILHYHPDKKGVITPERKKIFENKVVRARNAMDSLMRKLN